jgi:hypothetical protein
MMQYREITPVDRHEAEAIFDQDDLDIIRLTLLRVAYHEPDYVWAQDCCLRFCNHQDSQVRSVAALCLGHIARIHRQLDLNKVMPVLRRLLTDELTAGRAEDALDDIKRYIIVN